jgi:antitoxin HicB
MKNKLSYPAILTPDLEEGGFVVTFPDLPEAITQGDTLKQAQQAASDCLEEAIAGRMRLNQLLAQPSNLKKGQYLIDLPTQTAIKAMLYQALQTANITKVELARKIHCDEKEVRRLLDPRHTSKLARLELALQALGYKLVISSQPTR